MNPDMPMFPFRGRITDPERVDAIVRDLAPRTWAVRTDGVGMKEAEPSMPCPPTHDPVWDEFEAHYRAERGHVPSRFVVETDQQWRALWKAWRTAWKAGHDEGRDAEWLNTPLTDEQMKNSVIASVTAEHAECHRCAFANEYSGFPSLEPQRIPRLIVHDEHHQMTPGQWERLKDRFQAAPAGQRSVSDLAVANAVNQLIPMLPHGTPDTCPFCSCTLCHVAAERAKHRGGPREVQP